MDYSSRHPDKGSEAIASALDVPRSRIRPWLDGGQHDAVRATDVASGVVLDVVEGDGSPGWISISGSTQRVDHVEVLVVAGDERGRRGEVLALQIAPCSAASSASIWYGARSASRRSGADAWASPRTSICRGVRCRSSKSLALLAGPDPDGR